MTPRIAVPHWRAPTSERTRYYHDSLRQAGAEVLVVASDDLPAQAEGLLLTGGVDVNPRLFGERRAPRTDRPNRRRDQHELLLLDQALARDLPVLAICRGHQLLNVALGGTVLQDIPGDLHRWQDDDSSRWHEVNLTATGRLARIYNGTSPLPVNSRHHQGVTTDRLAPELTPVAVSSDGFIEAVESRRHRWVIGVQWHPERPEMHPDSDPLFAAFVAACYDRI